MTDKFDDNLISGYLDNQLTPEERAEVEASLLDSDTNRLMSDLERQSQELKRLPKFSLGQDFAQRILADDRSVATVSYTHLTLPTKA